MKKYYKKQIVEFLKESNAIEGVYGEYPALKDSLEAWDFAYKNRKEIDIDYILEIHRLLMKNLNPRIAGKFRDCDVWIGGHRKIFVSEALLKSELKDVLSLINSANPPKDKEAFAKHAHILFEKIHPFEDCNGRTGRILYNIHRINLGLDIHIIHTGKEQMSYYQWFK